MNKGLSRMYEEHFRVGMVIDRDGGKILIEAKDRGAYYEFAIADDGSGIAESQRQRIFEMFYTVDNSTSTTNAGIGLALVIIKKE